MGYSAKAVANSFLDISRKKGSDITPLQMQKLVYIAHGWWMALHGENDPLIGDEYAEAWEYGPVFPSIYHEFKVFRSDKIKEPATDLVFDDLVEGFEFKVPSIPIDDKFTRLFLDHISNTYEDFTGLDLSTLTHRENTPWSDTIEKHGSSMRNLHIDNGLIATYYRKKLDDEGKER